MKAIARLAMRLANAAQSTMSPFVQHFSAGHFYSPLPDVKWLRRQRRALFDRTATECPGVDLREAQQQEVLDELAVFYDELPFPASPDPLFRYHYENRYFSYGDAVVLYAMLRRLRPQRVVEVGSGFSSAAMLDIDERFLGGKTQFTFIEPHPERLLALLRQQDLHRCSVLQMPVQKVNLATFAALAAGDVLFVDSSHVVKIGNDVRHLLSQVLPRLRDAGLGLRKPPDRQRLLQRCPARRPLPANPPLATPPREAARPWFLPRVSLATTIHQILAG